MTHQTGRISIDLSTLLGLSTPGGAAPRGASPATTEKTPASAVIGNMPDVPVMVGTKPIGPVMVGVKPVSPVMVGVKPVSPMTVGTKPGVPSATA